MISRKTCRVCNSNKLREVLSLGNFYLPEFRKEKKYGKYPLELIMCQACGLVQLKHTVPREVLYNDAYGYRSGVNNTMRQQLSGIVKKALEIIGFLKGGEVVVDIGCSDGTLLKNYGPDVIKVGFDPVAKFGKYFDGPNMHFVNDYFSFEAVSHEFRKKKAKIITAIAMFYDLDDPNDFVFGVKKILDKDGIFIIQQNYLVAMLKQNAFDNIVHEHLEYYCLLTLERLLSKHNLEVFDVSQSDINGGSFRTYIKHAGSGIAVSKRVKKMRDMERKLKIDDPAIYHQFAKRASRISDRLKSFVKREVDRGKTVYIYGASTRGNTLLQYAGIDSSLVRAAVERNPEKWGKKITSVGIPIISEQQARKEKPDYMFVLPWFFKEEFIEREKEYLQSGGKFIFPLPKFEIAKCD